jgi:hypothetical protein
MFPGITGIYDIALDLPAAIASFSLPFFAYRLSHNMTAIVIAFLAVASPLVCTLGTSLTGPLLGTALAGVAAAVS